MSAFRICLPVACGVLAALLLAHGGEAPFVKLSDEETRLLDLTNQERKKKELAPLRPNPKLIKLARDHSANMARQGKMKHDLDGKTPFDRMRDAGYHFVKGGENIAACAAKISQPEVLQAWMESKIHRENILQPEYTEIGIGLARDKDGQIYYTQLFAKPRDKH
jgi:uncharacterized protein YkwD